MAVQQPKAEKTSIQLHYVYTHADRIFSNELEKHLAILQRQGFISEWASQEISRRQTEENEQELRKVILSLSTRLNQETKEQFILAGQTYYDTHDYDAALAAYDRALSFDPKDEIVSFTIGRILLHLERYEDALHVYDNLPSMSTPASTYLFKGIALQHLGRFADALSAYQKAREYGFSG